MNAICSPTFILNMVNRDMENNVLRNSACQAASMDGMGSLKMGCHLFILSADAARPTRFLQHFAFFLSCQHLQPLVSPWTGTVYKTWGTKNKVGHLSKMCWCICSKVKEGGWKRERERKAKAKKVTMDGAAHELATVQRTAVRVSHAEPRAWLHFTSGYSTLCQPWHE